MTNDIQFSLSDVLSDNEIHEIAENELRIAIRNKLKYQGELDRIMNNLAWHTVYEAVDWAYHENGVELEPLLLEKVKKCIDELHDYTVFADGDTYRRESEGHKALTKAIEESKPYLEHRVKTIIDEYPFNELSRDEIGDAIYECIMNKLFGTQEG